MNALARADCRLDAAAGGQLLRLPRIADGMQQLVFLAAIRLADARMAGLREERAAAVSGNAAVCDKCFVEALRREALDRVSPERADDAESATAYVLVQRLKMRRPRSPARCKASFFVLS